MKTTITTEMINSTSADGHLKTIKSNLIDLDTANAAVIERVKELNTNLQVFADTLLSCKQICQKLKIKEEKLIKLRNMGLIPFVKIGRVYHYLNLEKN